MISLAFSANQDTALATDTDRCVAQAEIILLGVSRTSKTPVSIYLSYRGWKVTNIPIVYNLNLPEELESIDQKKIIGFTINPRRLQQIRIQRQQKFQNTESKYYSDLDYIKQEITYALRLYQKNIWPILDVTYKSIEEIATEVMQVLYSTTGKKKGHF